MVFDDAHLVVRADWAAVRATAVVRPLRGGTLGPQLGNIAHLILLCTGDYLC